MSFDGYTKHTSENVSSSKILILSILGGLAVCLIVILLCLNSITKRRGRAVEALTSAPIEAEISPIVVLDNDELTIQDDVNDVIIKKGIEPISFFDYTVCDGDSVAKIAKKFNLRNQTIIQINALKTIYPDTGTVLSIPSMDGQFYTVQNGDSFFTIAQRFSLSMSWNTLKAINNIASDTIAEGMTLFIPYVQGEVYAEVSDISSEADAFSLPVKSGTVTVDFANTFTDPISGISSEIDGIIIQTLAASDVVCSMQGSVVDRGFNSNGTSFVKIAHGDGYTTYYDYLTWVNVEVGQRISKGATIGSISEGNTKLVSPTLFFRIEQDGIALNPSSFF